LRLSDGQKVLVQARFDRWINRAWIVESLGGPDALMAIIRREIEIDPTSLQAANEAGLDTWRPGNHARLLHHEPGLFGEIVVTEDSYNIRSMRFGVNGARQSLMDIDAPHSLLLRYARTAMLALMWLTEPRTVLVLGLGAGSIPNFIRRYVPGTAVDVVEIDPAVLSVAQNYFNLVTDDFLKVYIEDGRHFVERSTKRYDLIIVDVYATDMLPKHLTTVECLRAFRSLLTTEGMIVGNAWGADLSDEFMSVYQTFKSVFSWCSVAIVPNVSNRLIFASMRPRPLNLATQRARAKQASSLLGLPFQLDDYLVDENEAINNRLMRDLSKPEMLLKD